MKKNLLLIAVLISVISCKKSTTDDRKLNVVTTTTMITDLVKNVGGDLINVQGLMGSGVDPHLYKASEGDVTKLASANIIFYGGLHLEGKLVEVFEKMQHQNINAVALSDALDQNTLISSAYFKGNHDPHIWFNIGYWKTITSYVVKTLTAANPEYEEQFEANGKAYLKKLETLEIEIKSIIETLPQEKRILVTAHDAFSYFGKEYGFNVVGLQGISTATEAGVKDVQKLATFIIDNKVKAIFVESSVPKRTIEALKAAVNSKDHEVEIGGTLYSDALGNAGTIEGTYIGMFKYNVNTIVNALK